MKEGWTYKKLGEVCDIFGRIGFRGYTKNDLVASPDDGAITLSPSNIVNGEMDFAKCSYITWEKYEESPEIMIYPGDILIVKTASVGKTALVKHLPHKATINPQFVVLKNITAYNQYLSYYLKSRAAQDYIWSIAKGAAAQTVSQKNLAEMIVPIPSLDEQKRIVERLDAAFEKIDKLKANAEKQLAEARTLFQKSLAKAMEPKEGWEEKTLKDVADFVRGPFGGSLTKSMFKSEGFAVYEQQHAIHGHINIRYYIDSEKFKEMERFSVEAGDLIMSCSGVTLGRVNLLPSNTPVGIINQALLKMKVIKNTDARYFKFWLESVHFQKIIKEYSGGAAIPNVPAVKILKDIKISIPSLAEQQRIVERLDALSENIRKYEEIQRQIISECDALKQALLRKVFE